MARCRRSPAGGRLAGPPTPGGGGSCVRPQYPFVHLPRMGSGPARLPRPRPTPARPTASPPLRPSASSPAPPRSALVELETRGLPHRPRRHGSRPRPSPRLRRRLRSPRPGAAPQARRPRRRRRPSGPHRLDRRPDENRFFSGLTAAAVGYPQAVVAPDGTVRPGRREAELGISRGVFPRRAGATRRRGLPGRGEDPRPRADAPALRRLAWRPRPLPAPHRPRRLRPGRCLRGRTRRLRPPRPPLPTRLECLRLPRYLAERPARRLLRVALPRTLPTPRSLAPAPHPRFGTCPRSLPRLSPELPLRPGKPALLPRRHRRSLHLLLLRGRLRPRERHRWGPHEPRFPPP